MIVQHPIVPLNGLATTLTASTSLSELINVKDSLNSDLPTVLRQFSQELMALIALPPPPIPDPFVALSTVALVTVSDMVPFVPCQPLAITLGSQYGVWAFPICVLGQFLAGAIAFSSARAAADSTKIQEILDSLGEASKKQFEEFRDLGKIKQGSDPSVAEEWKQEGSVFLALVGLRLAPFFPFSAGNYLLGAGTGVTLRPFLAATLLGCLLSNFLSVSVGIGGAELWQQQQQQLQQLL